MGELLAHLKDIGYRFVTPTPATHERVVARAEKAAAHDLRGVFGWSLPFAEDLIDPALCAVLDAAGLLDRAGGRLKSRVRVSSLGEDLYLHSAFPTAEKDAVFFGPDSYRFAELIARELATRLPQSGARLLDLGTGSGVGGIVAGHLCRDARIELTDVNPLALGYARVNAAAAGVPVSLHHTDTLADLAGSFDLILANPPYIIDAAGRAYRDGGGMHGGEVSLEMAREAVPRLAPNGRFILYTGSAIVGGEDALCRSLQMLAAGHGCRLTYAEIDPDVFGEELDNPAYRDVERIALVSAVVERGTTA